MVTIIATTYFTNRVVITHPISLSRAIDLMGHRSAIIPPDAGLVEVHSPSQVVLVPDQIIFNVDGAFVPKVAQPTKRGVYNRDHGICAYCGKWVTFTDASIDHIVPQAHGGPTEWENLVNACRTCNQRKADRTPAQARMPLRFQPFTPKVRLRPD